MKIENLNIRNFRGITRVEMNNLGDMIVIAGQNGSGKSCIFDAVRLLKSVYGGYQNNEWQQWMGEFQIVLSNKSSDFKSLFNDSSKDLEIVCDFNLSQSERKFVHANALELLKDMIWKMELPEAYNWGGYRMAMFAAQIRDREPAVQKRAEDMLPQLITQLAQPMIKARCFIPVGQQVFIENSVALSVMFSTFRPNDIGVIDYHSAQRHYGRENVQGINLNLEATEQQRSQTALYNASGKYNNVKSEMAASYIKAALSEKAGFKDTPRSLSDTLKGLFSTFFPEKEFLGPVPTAEGALTFPVRMGSGSVHDLDELSAGEKEILYGYLRIRNSAPKDSIIIMDEPELHLNPRLIRGLPQFYKKNLGEALGNQIWLVTHSDALLREVVGKENYDVFHMLPCTSVANDEPQLKPLKANADLELALVDLVGDLASFRPNGNVVIFEGGGDSDFDRRVVAALFPELQAKANLVSGTNKARVRALHETLATAAEKGQLPFKFYAVVDRDTETVKAGNQQMSVFNWDVYHIENYFLNAAFIRKVLMALGTQHIPKEEDVVNDLRIAATETMDSLTRHDLSAYANSILVQSISTKSDPSKSDIAGEIFAAIKRSKTKIDENLISKLSEDQIRGEEHSIKQRYQTALANGTWIKDFRGRDILRKYVGKHVPLASYEVFRNLILSKMQDEGYRPAGMKAVVDSILAS